MTLWKASLCLLIFTYVWDDCVVASIGHSILTVFPSSWALLWCSDFWRWGVNEMQMPSTAYILLFCPEIKKKRKSSLWLGYLKLLSVIWGFSGGSVVKNLPASAGYVGLIPGSGKSPGEGNGNPLQYSCLEKSHGQRSLAGHSAWGCKRVGQDWAKTPPPQLSSAKIIKLNT